MLVPGNFVGSLVRGSALAGAMLIGFALASSVISGGCRAPRSIGGFVDILACQDLFLCFCMRFLFIIFILLLILQRFIPH